jgi:hypothetical protein
MEAPASKNRSKQTTPVKRVFIALSPDDALRLITKSLETPKLEITEHEIKRLVKRLVRSSEALEANCLILCASTSSTDNSINLKSHSKQNFIQSLLCESGKLLSKSK